MATATQSLDEDTFRLLGGELGYDIRMVSPEEEEREALRLFNIDLEIGVDTEEDEPRGPSAGRDRHGSRRPRKDAPPRRDPQRGGRRRRGRWHHPAHRRLPDPQGARGRRAGHHLHRHPGSRGVHRHACPWCEGHGHRDPRRRRRRRRHAADHRGAQPRPGRGRADRRRRQQDRRRGRQPSKIRQQLTEYNLVAEEYGGETMFVDVSAKQGQNIDQPARGRAPHGRRGARPAGQPRRDARGIAIEANLDKGRGATATVLIQSGTLRVGDAIVAGSSHGRVRAMLDEHGNQVPEALPSRPVQVLGLHGPRAGDIRRRPRRPHRAPDRREA